MQCKGFLSTDTSHLAILWLACSVVPYHTWGQMSVCKSWPCPFLLGNLGQLNLSMPQFVHVGNGIIVPTL